jgi:hypothetical protein
METVAVCCENHTEHTDTLCGHIQTFSLKLNKDVYIVWNTDPLLGNEREISNYTTAVAK